VGGKMKKIIIMIGLFLLMSSCGKEIPFESLSIFSFFKGEHPVRKMMNTSKSTSSMGGFFIFGIGGFSSSSETKNTVTFAWKLTNGNYAISTIDLTKVQVEINNYVPYPFIKFNINKDKVRSSAWVDGSGYWESLIENGHIQDLIDIYCSYVTIICKESDWKIDINMPLESRGGK
jgi:hypothetical protein